MGKIHAAYRNIGLLEINPCQIFFPFFFKQKLELAQQSNLSLKLSIIIVIFGKVADAENTFLIHSFFPSFS